MTTWERQTRTRPDRIDRLDLLSWIVLGGAVVTTVSVAAGTFWFANQSVLFLEPDAILREYLRCLGYGFLNPMWGLLTVGMVCVWMSSWDRTWAARRLAIGLSLVFVHQFLLCTLVFILLWGSSNP